MSQYVLRMSETTSTSKQLNATIFPLFDKIIALMRSNLENTTITLEIQDAMHNISESIDRALNSLSKNSIKEFHVCQDILENLSQFRDQVLKLKSFDLFTKFYYREEVKNSVISHIQVLWDHVIYSINFDEQCDLLYKCAESIEARLTHLFEFIHTFVIDRKYEEALKISLRLLNLNQKNILKKFHQGIVMYWTGVCYRGLRDWNKAGKYFNDALDIFKSEKLVSDNPEYLNYIATSEKYLGETIMASNRFEKAVDHFMRAEQVYRKIFETTNWTPHHSTGINNTYTELCDVYAYLIMEIAICYVNLENYSVANEFVSKLIEERATEINFASNKMLYSHLIWLENVLFQKGFTVDWLERCINTVSYEFDYDWKDPKCRIAVHYIDNGEPVKGVKLLLDYNNEFEKRYRFPYNINAAYGILCALLDISDINSEYKTSINIFEEIPEINVWEWVFKALTYFKIMNRPRNFKLIQTKCLNTQIIQFPLPLTETKLCDHLMYKINSDKELCRGICVIIHNITFLDEREWRNGSIMDAMRLIYIFNAMKYKVIVLNDQINLKILMRLKEIASQEHLRRHDSFVCITLSHGNNGIIYCPHERVIYTHEILNLFSDTNCPHLAKKPKIFIFNCCRGAKTYECDAIRSVMDTRNLNQSDVESAMFDWHDMFIWYSTIEGFVSYRHCTKGAVFIDNLIKVLEEYASDNNLLDLAKKVERSINAELAAKSYKQITSIETYGWSKDFYFIRNNIPVEHWIC